MANIKHIVITIVISLLLLGGIGAWVAYQKGEIEVPLQEASDTYSEVPGPLEPLAAGDANTTTMNTEGTTKVTLATSMGDIVLELYTDRMPITAGNFIKLANENFYDNTKFHRVIDGFMIQGGDPNSKGENTAVYGQGGPGYTIQDEFVEGEGLSNVRGTIAMANTGQPNSGGSQFFINIVDNTGLDFNKEPFSSKHPVFGKVIDGMDIVDRIAKVETAARDVPVDPIIIKDVIVEGGEG